MCKAKWKKVKRVKGALLLFHTREDHALNVGLRVNFVISRLSSKYPESQNWVFLQK